MFQTRELDFKVSHLFIQLLFHTLQIAVQQPANCFRGDSIHFAPQLHLRAIAAVIGCRCVWVDDVLV
jgi:hypothetical protein